jgi:pimeloyl-ACP methyl ester carboxylesterase
VVVAQDDARTRAVAHGDSSAPTGGYNKASTARRVRQAVQRLGFQRVQILAHDIGGAVAYAYARDFPTEVTRLAVLESPLAGFGLDDLNSFTWHILFNATRAPISGAAHRQ